MPPEGDTDWQKKHGFSYSRLIAAANGPQDAPRPAHGFDTATVGRNFQKTIEVLTARLDDAYGRIRQLEAELAQARKAACGPCPGPSNAPTGPASDTAPGSFTT